MIANLPTLPPAFLESCLAFSKQLYTMKSGVAKLEVSPSHFVFSMNQIPGNKEAGPTFTDPIKRKKTPSDLRRNAERIRKFLENKKLTASSGTSALSQSPVISPLGTSSIEPPNKDEEQIPNERNISSPAESSSNPSSTPPMDLSENSEIMDIVDETLPVNLCTRNNSETKDDDVSHSTASNEQHQEDLPPAISPINSPIKSDAEQISDKEEIRLLFCAPNQAAASKLAQKYSQAKYIGTHPSNKRHHFYFSAFFNSAKLKQPSFKEAIMSSSSEDFLQFGVVSEKTIYEPEHLLHCAKCRSHHLKK